MFSGFYINLDQTLFSSKSIAHYMKAGKAHLCEAKRKYDDSLARYKFEEALSASLIEKDWFPTIDVDVFISHSRVDEELVEAFAGWLNDTFGLKCFLDSHVWNHANILISLLDNKYSNPEKKDNVTYYCYTKSNKVCEHANMMLAVALQKMIDRTESLFFVNAGNAAHLLKGHALNETYSPWIYTELACANMVRKKPLIVYRSYKNQPLEKHQSNIDAILECLQISYPLNLKGLEKLDIDKLHKWTSSYKHANFEYPLDALYGMTGYKSELNRTEILSRHISGAQLEKIQRMFSRGGEDERGELHVLMESVNAQYSFLYGECPVYGGCRCRCCGEWM